MPSTPSRMGTSREADQLGKFLSAMGACWSPEGISAKPQAADSLREYVEGEAHSLSPEAFARFVGDLYTRIFNMVSSTQVRRKVCGCLRGASLCRFNGPARGPMLAVWAALYLNLIFIYMLIRRLKRSWLQSCPLTP